MGLGGGGSAGFHKYEPEKPFLKNISSEFMEFSCNLAKGAGLLQKYAAKESLFLERAFLAHICGTFPVNSILMENVDIIPEVR